jgi:DnaJ-class molecular chaperone
MPFGGGFGGGGASYGGGARSNGGAAGGYEGFEGGFPGGDTADLSDIFEGLFSGARQRGGFGGGFGRRQAPPQKGTDVAYRLRVPFAEAATLAPQRVTLRDGKTIDLQLPKGVEDGTKIRLAGKGETGPAGRGDAIVTIAIEPHRFFTRDGKDVRLSLPVTLKEAVLGAKVRVPTPDGPVMLTVPKGSTSGKVLRIKGRGFSDRSGTRGDQLVTLSVDLPAGDAALEQFAGQWSGGGNPRAAMGV